MKKYFFLTALLFIAQRSISQNYQTVVPDKELVFSSTNWTPITILGSSFNYSSVTIDSTTTLNGSVIYHHHRLFREVKEYCFNKFAPNWTGLKTIIKPSGENIFLTTSKDSIRIKPSAEINDTWHFFDFPNGDYFEARIISKTKNLVLDFTDSLKTISLSLKNSSGALLAHDFNTRFLILSKNYGLVRAYDFSKFPSDTSAFTLAGISNPMSGVQNITARGIFDFNVGDEFHTRYFLNPSNTYSERKIVLSKYVSLNDDTLQYTIQLTKQSIIDTIDFKVIVSERPDLNAVPWTLIKATNALEGYEQLNTHFLKPSDYNIRLMKIEAFSELGPMMPEDSCYFIPLSNEFGSSVIQYHIAGLGSYFEGSHNHFGYPIYKKLAFYKKGSEIWGTPENFEIVESAEKPAAWISSKAYPNPFSEYTVLTLNNPTGRTHHLSIIDSFGQVIKEYSFKEESLKIANEGMSGIYFYKLYNDQNETGSGKLIVY